MRVENNTINAIVADILKGVYSHPDSSILESYNDGEIEVRADVDNELYLLGFEITDADGNLIEQEQYDWLIFELEEQLKRTRVEAIREAQYLKWRAWI